MDNREFGRRDVFGGELEYALYTAAERLVSRKKAAGRWRVAGFVVAAAAVVYATYVIVSLVRDAF